MQNISKVLLTSRRVALSIHKRTFLNQEYFCYEQWDKFLASDLMVKVGKVNSLSIELDQKLKEKKPGDPVRHGSLGLQNSSN